MNKFGEPEDIGNAALYLASDAAKFVTGYRSSFGKKPTRGTFEGGSMSPMGSDSHDHDHRVFQRFFHWEAAGSIVLLATTIVALVWANSPWADSYYKLTKTYLGISLGDHSFKMSLQHWVNDALMVVFFFVVGLEIKREMVLGHLSSLKQAIVPVMAAVNWSSCVWMPGKIAPPNMLPSRVTALMVVAVPKSANTAGRCGSRSLRTSLPSNPP